MNPLTDTPLPSPLPLWHAVVLWGPALVSCAAAACSGLGLPTPLAWRAARWATATSLAFAAAALIVLLSGSRGVAYGVRADEMGAVVMLVVSFVGWIVVRYAQTYLSGEANERLAVRWLLSLLAAVGVAVSTNNVLVLGLAWTATSLALHQLLIFFADRSPAVVAAHKKFIISRTADVCMLLAALLLFHAFESFQIDQILRQAASEPSLPWSAQTAVCLMACAAMLKCAQLPFHGWLIQVMEAPTPVSALLHAGVVNLGGFVLMRFAPLVAEVTVAQGLLVAAGTTTAVLASLVMSTRISVKVMLSWSTCAQMGFMLMQCGLGAWEMALLHLVAHSLYKAHAFLSAGGAVRQAMITRLTPRDTAPGLKTLLTSALLGIGMTIAAGVAWHALGPHSAQPNSPAIWVLAGIVSLALAPLVRQTGASWHAGKLPARIACAFAIPFFYFALHTLLASWLPWTSPPPAPALWIAVATSFVGLFALQSMIAMAPQGVLARRLYPWFYGGLFLDEAFTRMSFAVWPPPQTRAKALSS